MMRNVSDGTYLAVPLKMYQSPFKWDPEKFSNSKQTLNNYVVFNFIKIQLQSVFLDNVNLDQNNFLNYSTPYLQMSYKI